MAEDEVDYESLGSAAPSQCRSYFSRSVLIACGSFLRWTNFKTDRLVRRSQDKKADMFIVSLCTHTPHSLITIINCIYLQSLAS
jgi:hypothetical protein